MAERRREESAEQREKRLAKIREKNSERRKAEKLKKGD